MNAYTNMCMHRWLPEQNVLVSPLEAHQVDSIGLLRNRMNNVIESNQMNRPSTYMELVFILKPLHS